MLFVTHALAEEAAEEVIEEAAEESVSWLSQAFSKFAEFPVWGWVLVAVLLIGGVIAEHFGYDATFWTMAALHIVALVIYLLLTHHKFRNLTNNQ